jgi:hypothetical protein
MFLWEQFSSQTVHHFTSPVVFMPFWTGSFLIVGHEKGGIPWPPGSQHLTALDFFLGFVKDITYRKVK